jgi:hypothetical protein
VIEPRVAEVADRLRPALERARWGETGELVLETAFSYGDEPVRIRVRKRGRRYDLSDDGAGVRKAGAAGRGWLETAERVVADEGMNVNRRGVVFVPAVEGRDLAALAARLAETSLAVHAALLDDDR